MTLPVIGNKPKTKRLPANGFKKGQSGNPSGRPKATPEDLDLIAACKVHTTTALNTILEIMQHGENERNRLAAANTIIERAYGKPIQPTDTKVSGELITRIERIIIKPE